MLYSDLETLRYSNDSAGIFPELYRKVRYGRINEYYYKLLRLFLCGKTRILDLNAGLGELAIYLARHGYPAKARFSSDKMMHLALARAKAEGVRIETEISGGHAINNADCFGAILAANTVPAILNDYELQDMLQKVYSCLLDYGLFIFDFPSGLKDENDEVIPLENRMRLFRDQQFIRAEGISLVDWQLVSRNCTVKARECLKIRDEKTMQAILTAAGFRQIDFFDVCAQDAGTSIPKPGSSPMLICVARKVTFEDTGNFKDTPGAFNDPGMFS